MSRKIFWNLLLLLLVTPVTMMAQDVITVKGNVSDNTGEPLIGCTVQQKGGTAGVVADIDGNFTLQVPKGSTLVFSFIGYKTQELKATANMKVVMKEDSQTMNEVVVVGYGTMKRSDITGSVVSVKAEDMQQTSASTMDQMLQGRAAGMQLTSNSGAAGGSSSIQIRGVNSLNSSNEPVYVIDGAIITTDAGADVFSNPLADLNPNDVESIEILKDASATAIYGAQAANGVIIVNMKKGFEGSKPKINFKAQVGWDELPKKLDVMNLQQFAEWASVANQNRVGGSGPKESDIFANPATLSKGADWQDALFRNGLRQEYNVSVRGGGKGVNYSLSGGYFSQEGITINNDFKRLTLRGSFDVKAYKWLDLGATFNLGQSKRNTGMASWEVVPNALSDTPNNAVRNPDGSWAKSGYNEETDTWQPNPVAIAELTNRQNKVTSNRVNVYFTLKPWKWLSWKNEATYDTNTDNYRYLLPEYDLGGSKREYATHQNTKTYNQYWSVKSVATGNWKLKGGHKLSFMLGGEINHRYRDYLYGQRLGGSNTNMALSGGDASRDDNAGYSTTKRFGSVFSRATYNYKDRYMFTGTLRHDGSSLFERGQRWGTFPSAALAWRVSEEPFFAPLTEVVNSLKVRVGYGLVGNANLTESTFMANFANLESNFGTSYKTANMPNYDKLTWEKTDSWNAGIDLNLFDNRIEFIFDAFLKNTKDLLMQTALPGFSGAGKLTGMTEAQWANVGNMRNKGIEMTLNAHIINKKNLKWKTYITYSLVKNEVTKLNSESGFIDKTLDYEGSGEIITRTAVGYGISQFYGFQVAGRINSAADFLRNNGDGTSTVIAATPNYSVGTVVSNSSAKNLLTSVGDLLYKDLNGDGIINDNDKTYLGNGLPKYTFGWNNTVTWKQFSLSVFMYGSVGNRVFNWTRRRMDDPSLSPSGAAWNKYTRTLNYAKWGYYDGNSGNADVWNVYVLPGAESSIPRMDNMHNNYNSRISDRYVEDASYLRIKNITLTYSLPKQYCKKLYLSDLKLSANVQNVYTLTGYTGYDPEVGSQNGQYGYTGQGMLMYGVDTGRVPSPRTVIFGIEATF